MLEHVASGASGAFASSNPGDALISLVFALKAGYRRGANWLMNSKTIAATRKLKDGQGNYLWQQSVTVGQPDLLLGYPVLAAEDMPDIAANSLSIAFGNFQRGHTVVDRHPMRMLRDPYTAKPHVLFYTYRRVGGDVMNTEAIKLLKFATSYRPLEPGPLKPSLSFGAVSFSGSARRPSFSAYGLVWPEPRSWIVGPYRQPVFRDYRESWIIGGMPYSWPSCSNEEIEQTRLHRRGQRLEDRLKVLRTAQLRFLYRDDIAAARTRAGGAAGASPWGWGVQETYSACLGAHSCG